MLIFVFGKMGAGKTYVAGQLAAHLNYLHYKGDNALTPSQLRWGFFSKNQVESYIKKQLIPQIELLLKTNNPDIVICQALYFEEHRAMITEYFKSIGEQSIFLNVVTSRKQQENQLYARSVVWYLYGKFNNFFFEPSPTADKIYNIPEVELISQFTKFVSKHKGKIVEVTPIL
ncbi:MAG: hypothetical protein Hyperionvirus1_191 [Hyperionvirus sp.]|uniref:Uncharacterized protein n=1 Tax=Hyperionvirus sp. TaxID=2487770 RepID=A0A3G5A6F9_9VIRU|nr:MAG: hypothetical protein Hyperionvirus1_191 [Hyperionvirus sp.]